VRQKRHEFSGKSQVFFSSREEEEEEEVGVEGEVGGERLNRAGGVPLPRRNELERLWARRGARRSIRAIRNYRAHIYFACATSARKHI